MSRGPGRIERAIVELFDCQPEGAFTTGELCLRVWPGLVDVKKKHRVSILRALDRLSRSRGARVGSHYYTCGLGGERIAFRCDNVLSYALARLKADWLTPYVNGDKRNLFWPRSTEEELRKRLAPGGKDYELVVEGGAWWTHTMQWLGEHGELPSEAAAKVDAAVESLERKNQESAVRLAELAASLRRA